MDRGAPIADKVDAERTGLDPFPPEIISHIFSYVFADVIEATNHQKPSPPGLACVAKILKPTAINRRLRVIGMDEALRSVLPGFISPEGDYEHQSGDLLVMPRFKNRNKDFAHHGPMFCGIVRCKAALELQIYVSLRSLLFELPNQQDDCRRRVAGARVHRLRGNLKEFVNMHTMAESLSLYFSEHDQSGEASLDHTGVWMSDLLELGGECMRDSLAGVKTVWS